MIEGTVNEDYEAKWELPSAALPGQFQNRGGCLRPNLARLVGFTYGSTGLKY